MNILYRHGLVERSFEPSEHDESGIVNYYYQYINNEGHWVILRKGDISNSLQSYRYATVYNNGGYIEPIDAWNARETLNYNYFHRIIL